MSKTTSTSTGSRTQRFCIWSVLYQDLIVYHFKVYIATATGVLLLLALTGRFPFEAVIHGMIVGGLSVIALVSLLIHARRRVLLEITDPVVREAAHEAMLLYLMRKPLSQRQRRRLVQRLGRGAESFGFGEAGTDCRQDSSVCREL